MTSSIMMISTVCTNGYHCHLVACIYRYVFLYGFFFFAKCKNVLLLFFIIIIYLFCHLCTGYIGV